MNVKKIQDLFEQSKDKYVDAKKIGTTYQSLYNLFHKGSVIKVDLLQKIAEYYKKPVGYFFDEEEETERLREQLSQAQHEICRLEKENLYLRDNKHSNTRVLIEIDVESDEFIKMGLKDKVFQALGSDKSIILNP